MILVFHRQSLPNGKVEVEVFATSESEAPSQIVIGKLIFPNSRYWSRFIGALQRGALQVPELIIDVEPMREMANPEGTQNAKPK